MSVRFCVLATGSKGNCAWLCTPHAQVLIDCGIGPRSLASALAPLGSHPSQLDAVFITHTHGDHVDGLALLLRQNPRLRLYATAPAALELRQLLGAAPSAEIALIEPDHGFYHRDIDALPVLVPHDCPPTVMYRLHVGDHTLGILTDLGEHDARIAGHFAACDVLLLEANYCPRLLATGPYPEELKRRIYSPLGHLSNEQAYAFASGLPRLPRLLLGHMSENNNTPAAAAQAFGAAVPPEALAWQRPQGRLGLDPQSGGPPAEEEAAAKDSAGDKAAGAAGSNGRRELLPHTIIVQRSVGPLIEL